LCLFDRELLSQLSPILYKSNDGHFAVQGFLPSPQSGLIYFISLYFEKFGR